MIKSTDKKVLDWLESKLWFLPKKATGFKALISFPKNKDTKKRIS